jgi:hypothetical protein
LAGKNRRERKRERESGWEEGKEREDRTAMTRVAERRREIRT